MCVKIGTPKVPNLALDFCKAKKLNLDFFHNMWYSIVNETTTNGKVVN